MSSDPSSDIGAVADPLKSLSELFAADERSEFLAGTLDALHADLASIVTRPEVPADVRQLLETAKNLSLYSWFAFRFHAAAEMVAFSALELGLNLKACGTATLPDRYRSAGLSQLLERAMQEGWLQDEGFESRPHYLERAIHLTKITRAIEAGETELMLPPSTDEELRVAGERLDFTAYLSKRWKTFRNALAHGSPMVAPTSRETLRIVAEALNQLFSHEPGKDSPPAPSTRGGGPRDGAVDGPVE